MAIYFLKNRSYLFIKLMALCIVGIALAAEGIPEVEAKMIVIPALIITLILGIIEIKKELTKNSIYGGSNESLS